MPTISALPAAAAGDITGFLVIVIGGVTYKITLNHLLQLASPDPLTIQNTVAFVELGGDGSLQVANLAGALLRLDPAGFLNIVPSGGQNIFMPMVGASELQVSCNGVDGLQVGTDPLGVVAARVPNRLDVGFSAAGSTLGTVIGKLPLYDLSGTFLGYSPIYDNIT